MKRPATATLLAASLALAGMAAGGVSVGSGAVASGKKRDMMPGGMMAHGRVAMAMLVTADGKDAGHAMIREMKDGLRVSIEARGLPAGTHGAHIHSVGQCETPAFASAGGHWNPTGHQHGTLNPMGPHGGDLPNLIVGANGRGVLGIMLPGATMDGLLDADGSAIVIHAASDDMKTDPSGNSGARIACGVISAMSGEAK